MWDFEFGLGGVLRLLISGFRVPVCKVLAIDPKNPVSLSCWLSFGSLGTGARAWCLGFSDFSGKLDEILSPKPRNDNPQPPQKQKSSTQPWTFFRDGYLSFCFPPPGADRCAVSGVLC